PARAQLGPKGDNPIPWPVHARLPEASSWGIAQTLNWIGQNSFGGLTQPRGLAGAYRWLLQHAPTSQREETRRRPHRWDVSPDVVVRAQDSELLSILLISPQTLAGMTVDLPDMLEMPVEEAVKRLTGLKFLLPACDVSHLVATEPRLYLGLSRQQVEEKVAHSLSLLDRYQVPFTMVQAMVMNDPSLLFVLTDRGLVKLRELWPADQVDQQALLDSDPRGLSFAVRAFSTRFRL
ncbi:hypothetical protein TSOC_009293, partial [Tetrabaena socialis]